MKKRIAGLFLASTLAIAAAGCATCSNSTVWEYKVAVEPVNGLGERTEIEKPVNDMAQQGWHLVSVSATDDKVVFVFKRHK